MHEALAWAYASHDLHLVSVSLICLKVIAQTVALRA